jgi:hypothetical protein
MLPMPAEEKALLEHHLTESARLMRKYTEPEKLKDFEGIEVEVRNQVQLVVAPTIRRIFLSKGGTKRSGDKRTLKTIVGEVSISQKQARKLGVEPKTGMSPGLEKCCLRVCAKTSYQQAEEDLRELMGIKVGHSSLHRLVQRKELPLAQSESQGISRI